MTKRLFIAIPVPREIRQKALELQQLWGQEERGIRWVSPKLMHITLHFLGKTSIQKLEKLNGALRKTTCGFSAFILGLGTLGVFRHKSRARILYIQVRELTPNLKTIQKNIGAELNNAGFKTENKTWQPHLTLGRLSQPRVLKIPDVPDQNIFWKVNSVQLIESILSPDGSDYRLINQIYF